MPIDFDSIQPTGWEKVCGELLRCTFHVGKSGWTPADKDATFCPYCHEFKCFSLNFELAAFNCFNCHNKGKLGQLVKDVLDVPKMFDAATYIKEALETPAAIPENLRRRKR